MKKRILNFLVTSFLLVNISFCQKIVPVFQEPRHNPVLLNKYLRVIEAQIENSDSSFFHVHAAPSAFVFLTDVVYDNQVLNLGWTKATSKKGHAWYSSFSDGPSTHRVAAPADGRIHAYDVNQPDTRVKNRDRRNRLWVHQAWIWLHHSVERRRKGQPCAF